MKNQKKQKDEEKQKPENTKKNEIIKINNTNSNEKINEMINDLNSEEDKNKKSLNNIEFEGSQDFEEAILEAFREFDKDRTDFITKEELGNCMRSLGYKVTEIELEDMINQVDDDGNGLIGIKEFRNLMMKSIKDEFTVNTSIEAFAIFDKYQADRINCTTLKEILLSKNGDTQFTEDEVNELLASLNKDNNDDVNYRDLIKNCFDIFNTEDAH